MASRISNSISMVEAAFAIYRFLRGLGVGRAVEDFFFCKSRLRSFSSFLWLVTSRSIVTSAV